ncbi:MAG TPA: WD40 repeat domain-containing protein [Opitutaceae bacterium]|nr:WD40 repeat domain-containing protein [Opitutaceae bacterium]
MQLTKHWAAALDDYAIDLAFSPDGTKIAAASAAGNVTIFQLNDGAKLHVLEAHDQGANCLSWAPTSATQLLATGGQDGAVKFWDAGAGQHLATAKLGNGWVEHLAWRPRAKTGASAALSNASDEPLLAASAGRQLVFAKADGTIQHTFKPAPKTISAIAWQPAGGCVAAAYFGGVCLWDANDFHVQKEFPYANGIHALVWSPDNKWLVSGNQDPSVHLWIPDTDVELHMSGYEGKVKELSFDQTGRWLATGGGKDACLWDCSGEGPEGREPLMFPHDAKVCAVAFQNSHSLLATASQDGAVMLWSPDRKQPLRATIKMPHAATKLIWSPDDRYLAIGSEQGAVYVLKCEA